MSRLVTFGCSHTYGYGLPDLTTGPGPSKLAWPSVLSKSLNLELVNHSYPGWSNTKILYEVLNFDYKKDDVVVVLWASIDRGMIYFTHDKEHHIGSWNEDESSKKYFMLHTDADLAMKTLTAIHHADLFMLNKNIKCKHFIYTNKFYKTIDLAIEKTKWFTTVLQKAYILGMSVDRANDDLHYGVKTHVILSNYIKKFL